MPRSLAHGCWAIGALLFCQAGGCGESKRAQCQRLVEILNSGQFMIAEGQDPASFAQLGDQAQQISDRLRRLKLKDPGLLPVQERSQTAVKGYVQAARALADAVGELEAAKSNPDSAVRRNAQQKAKDARQALGQKAQAINQAMSELTATCSQP